MYFECNGNFLILNINNFFWQRLVFWDTKDALKSDGISKQFKFLLNGSFTKIGVIFHRKGSL